jgi:Ala-tRNA(Pro) deacylase
MLLARVVDYLRSNGIGFRLESYPSPEPKPSVAPPDRLYRAFEVDTHLVMIDGSPAIACVPAGEGVMLLQLREALGAKIVGEGDPRDLPWPFAGAPVPIPPLGHLFGVPVFLDAKVASAPVLGFQAFSNFDFIEAIYDDFARIEQPRVLEFAGGGELPAPQVH